MGITKENRIKKTYGSKVAIRGIFDLWQVQLLSMIAYYGYLKNLKKIGAQGNNLLQ